MKCLLNNEHKRTRKKQNMQYCDICFQTYNKQDAQIIESEFQAYGKACNCNRTHKK